MFGQKMNINLLDVLLNIQNKYYVSTTYSKELTVIKSLPNKVHL